jgi:Ca2+-binding RTX toxin-like protein
MAGKKTTQIKGAASAGEADVENLIAVDVGAHPAEKPKTEGPVAAQNAPGSATSDHNDSARGILHRGSAAPADLRLQSGGETGAGAPSGQAASHSYDFVDSSILAEGAETLTALFDSADPSFEATPAAAPAGEPHALSSAAPSSGTIPAGQEHPNAQQSAGPAASAAQATTDGAQGTPAPASDDSAPDTVAAAPSLSVSAASGAEDTAIALDIGAALGDLDGSESLSITISGVPLGAQLSAGTDLGGGNWSLTPAQLTGLTITPPANSDADFTLTVTATATEADGGDTTTITAQLPVTINAVADTPSLTVAAASGSEDAAIALDIGAALGDLDGSESLVVTISGVPSGAQLSAGTDLGSGTWSLTPAQLTGLTITPPANSDGDFTLTVTATATDADGGDTAVVTAQLPVTVAAVADTPTLNVAPAAGSEDTAISLDVSAALGDLDGSESLVVTISGVPSGAQLSAGTDLGGGTWSLTPAQLTGLTITPPANSDGDFTLTVTATATEAQGGDTAVVTAQLPVTVAAVADTPTLNVAPAAGSEDTAIALDIGAALGDLDGSESLVVTISGVPTGAQLSAGTDLGGGTWTLSPAQLTGLTITPPANSDGDFTLTVTATATESQGGDTAVVSAQLSVTVNAVADSPSLTVAPASGSEDTAIALDIGAALGDLDGSESLVVTISGVPSGAQLSAGTDLGGGTWTLNPAQLTGLTITPPANSDGDFTLTVTATATEAQGGDTAIVTAQLPVTVSAVADAPSLSVAPASGSEDTAIALDIGAALGDLDGSESLVITISGVPSGAQLSAGTDLGGGTWSLTAAQLTGLTVMPPASNDADFTLTVTATATEADGGDTAVATAQVPVTVNAVADTPTLSVAPASGSEDTTIALDIGAALGDLDGSESLVVTISGVPSGAQLSAGTDLGGGTWTLSPAQLTGLTITPPANSDGDFTLTVTATATEGDGGDTATITAQLPVIVSAVADAPSLSVAPAAGSEDTAIALDIGAALGDLDGSESLTITIGGVPSGAQLSAGTDLGGGTWSLSPAQLTGLTITPPANSEGDFTLTVTATATEAQGGGTAIVTAQLPVTVSAVADTPSLTVTAASGAEDSAIALDIGAALGDLDGSESLVITISGVPSGAQLSAGTDLGGGTWTLSPAQLAGLTVTPPANGDADFTLTVTATATEAQGGDTAVATAQVPVTVNAVADAPTLSVAPASGSEDTAIALNVGAALGDLDGSEGLVITISGVPSGAQLSAGTDLGGGTWSLTPAQLTGLTITPPANSDGDFTLTVAATATEAQGGDTAVVTAQLPVTVTPVADTPILTVGNASAQPGVPFALPVGAQLADLDGSESLTVTISGLPAGTVLSAGQLGPGGVWTLSQSDLAGLQVTVPNGIRGDFPLSITATSTELDGGATASTSANFTLNIDRNLTLTLSHAVLPDGSQDTSDSFIVAPGTSTTTTLTGADLDIAGVAPSAGVTVSTDAAGNSDIRLDSAWGSVRNIRVEDDQPRDVSISNFVDAEVILGNGGPSNVSITDAQGGRVVTGDGADTVNIVARSDGSGGAAAHEIEVSTGAGNDTITIQAAANGLTRPLIDAGAGDDVVQVTGNSADQILGGDGNDTILADAGNDLVAGGAGNDTIDGGAGNDTIDGGADIDTASYASATAAVTVNLATTAAQNTGGAGTDTLTGIENLTGSSFDDVLTGDGGNNVLSGSAGNDTLQGGAGSDTLDGGTGADTASYAVANAAVTVNLAVGTAQNTGGAGTDTLIGIENLTGSNFNDTLVGNTGANAIDGGAGNDTMQGGAGNDTLVGGAGNDTIDGGADNDTASYASATAAVTVSLATTATQNTGGAGTDRLSNIENLVGSAFNDTLTGSTGNNELDGGAGNDTLQGGLGDDTIVGGAGIDTASYASATTAVTVDLSVTGAQNTGGAGIDTLSGVENLIGSGLNDTLTGDAGNNALAGGSGNDTLQGGAGNDTIDGGAGTDTATYAAAAAAVSVSLATTSAQNTGGAGTDTITNVENLTGSAFDDTLTGSTATNVIDGGAGSDTIDAGSGNDTVRGGTGDDVLIGGAGNDTIDGGADVDTASYATATSAVTVNLATTAAQNTGGGGTDTLTNLENLIGSGFNDTLTGSSGDNALSGGAGNDTLQGGLGNDTLDGAAGTDTASYASATSAVTVDLGITTAQNTGGAGNDRLIAIENLIGSAYNDTLTGDGGNNALSGGSGNDALQGGAGNDTIDGGAGTDTATYAAAAAAVTVSLATTAAQNTGGAGTDRLTSLENLTGSAFNDTLTGNTGANVIEGGAGNDTLQGGSGNDTLIGGTGNDTLDGGSNTDTASYASATAAVTVSLATTAAQNTGGAGADRLSNIENLTGSDFNDTLTGSTGNNVIDGGAGNDTIDAGSGNDTVLGGAGNDTLIGGAGTDRLDGGADVDTASYASSTAAVTVSLAITGSQNTVGAGSDTLISIENLTGSGFNDTLTGSAGDNVIDGGAGNDVLQGGAGNDTMIGGTGNDTIDGGANTDTASYASATSAVSVSLAITGAQNTVGAGTDTLTNIENLTGSNFNDTLTGSNGANTLIGGWGNDTLNGGAGDDILDGGLGNDQVIGGTGNDIYLFAFGGGTDVFNGGTAWTDSIALDGVNGPPGGGDWTITLTQGSVVSSSNGLLQLSQDAAGTIQLSDGSTLDFTNVETITW